jgi:hypothetical protein
VLLYLWFFADVYFYEYTTEMKTLLKYSFANCQEELLQILMTVITIILMGMSLIFKDHKKTQNWLNSDLIILNSVLYENISRQAH